MNIQALIVGFSSWEQYAYAFFLLISCIIEWTFGSIQVDGIQSLLDVNFLLKLNLPKGSYLGNDLFKNVISMIVVYFDQAVFNLFCSFSTFFSDFPSEIKKSKNEQKQFFHQNLAKLMKKQIFTKLWIAQHQNHGQNIQHRQFHSHYSPPPQTPPHINRIFISQFLS